MEASAEFAQERRNGRLGFVAKVATGTRVESNVAGPGGSKAGVFGMSAHRLSANLHLNGKPAPLERMSAYYQGRRCEAFQKRRSEWEES